MPSIARQIPARPESKEPPQWIRLSILAGVTIFVLALFGAAVVVPRLLLLHLLQALIYVAVLFLTRRASPWGFGIAVFIATAWNGLNLFVAHLFGNGAGLSWTFLRTKPSSSGHPSSNPNNSFHQTLDRLEFHHGYLYVDKCIWFVARGRR